MDYEKAYKEALERAKKLTSDMTTLQKIREFIFPELAESEDERIRKAILGLTYLDGIEPILTKCSITRQEIRSYLEKQKEQKSRIDACGFPLRDEGESACSYLERCLSPDMRNIWYEACSEIRGKQKSDSECNSNCATYKSHRESWQNRLKEIYKINSSK